MKVSELIEKLLKEDQDMEVKKYSWHTDESGEGSGYETYDEIYDVSTTQDRDFCRGKWEYTTIVVV